MSVQEATNLVNALNRQNIEFQDSLGSKGGRTIEIENGSFVKLYNMIGEIDKIDELKQKYYEGIIKNFDAPFQTGYYNKTIPVIFVNTSNDYNPARFTILKDAINNAGIPCNARKRSNGDMIIEVTGLENVVRLSSILNKPEINAAFEFIGPSTDTTRLFSGPQSIVPIAKPNPLR